MKTLKIKSIFSTILCVIWISGLSAQSLTVTGTVTDENDQPLIGANVSIEKSRKGTVTNEHGKYSIEAIQGDIIRFSYIGYKTQKVKANRKIIDVKLYPDNNLLMEECVITSDEVSNRAISSKQMAVRSLGMPALIYDRYANREEYSHNAENRFKSPVKDPLSTFSIDVDAASYSNIRRFINQGEMPPKDAVRIEEMINYFNYNYPEPTGNDPVRITTEVGICPWNKTHRLVQIGLKAREIENQNLPASNFVFLIDVSGSMFGPTRLELVKSSLRLLVNNLREKDRVAIVTYCGDARVALPSTPGNEKQKIKDALETLTAGGSTAGGAGIKEAYRIAQKNFIAQGNNRIILCTDGDFNVGASSETELENLIESKRKGGIFLTVLGYGMGNYKDNKMQILAQKGNGNHAYIDNIQEANKVLVNEFGSTMYAVAKDVKLQVEFNPAKVQSYRLVGYETRMLNNEDFNDDTKDAGEMGAGHTVTALYEIIPTGTPGNIPGSVDPLKYQSQTNVNAQTSNSSELLTVKLRYKTPEEEKSKKIEKSVTDMGKDNVSADFRFASAVAMFAQLLKDSDFKGEATYDKVIETANKGLSFDPEGYRAEFVRLVQSAKGLNK
ncbi:YfbK domain-containing protein [Coprobacter fastidiosus]|uniref:vWA domain-containing protein n=1 Tax=Coprobacter fastidiosus TaxID=1099853 RepID=UPI003AAA3A63